MTTYKVVNSDKLDADLKSVADAIRSKTKNSGSLAFPRDYVSAMEGVFGADTLVDRSITEISSPAEHVGQFALHSCSKLKSVNLPNATYIDNSAFKLCTSLTSVVFPKVNRIDPSAFAECTSLQTADFQCASGWGIYPSAFSGCAKLTALILRTTARVHPLSNKNAFTGTPIASGTGYIYVPNTKLEAYKSATNWSVYAAQFRAIEAYPDITGGTV